LRQRDRELELAALAMRKGAGEHDFAAGEADALEHRIGLRVFRTRRTAKHAVGPATRGHRERDVLARREWGEQLGPLIDVCQAEPRTLPLDANMSEESRQADAILTKVEDAAAKLKCTLESEIIQARDVSQTLVDEADDRQVGLIVLGMLRRGNSTSEIAERLKITPVTVRRHISSIVRKLGVADRAQLLPAADASPEVVPLIRAGDDAGASANGSALMGPRKANA